MLIHLTSQDFLQVIGFFLIGKAKPILFAHDLQFKGVFFEDNYIIFFSFPVCMNNIKCQKRNGKKGL